MSITQAAALSELLSLHTSWHEAVHAIGASSENEEASGMLFLATIGRSLKVARKDLVDRGWFLERLFLGEPLQQNLVQQICKVRKLFLHLTWQDISAADKDKLLHLESCINSIGRQVFAKKERAFWSLFEPYSFADFQVGFRKLPDPLPPPCATRRALRNVTGSLCWLNSLVKYICASPLYDYMLKEPAEDEEKEELRVHLHRLVTALRLGWQQPVVNTLQEVLLSYMKSAPSFLQFFTGQQDATEFIRLLQKPEQAPTNSQIATATLFTSKAKNIMKPGIERPGSLFLNVLANQETSIDLQVGFSKEETVVNVREYLIKKNGLWQDSSEEDTPQPFIKHDVCIHLPEYLEVWFTRGVALENHQISISKQCIEMDGQGQLCLIESFPCYEMVNGQAMLRDAEIKTICTYKAVAAIQRLGADQNRGHFVAHLRENDGSISTHSDNRIQSKSPESIWKTTSLLTLKRISAYPIPPS
jgi:hypothetical protein